MQEPSPPLAPLTDRSGVTDAVRAQLLATEHWNLLATRTMTWNEVFSRASIYFTVLSAAVVALALVAQATNFGDEFRLFALLTLPVVLVIGLGTMIRLSHANRFDVVMVIGMNRLRRAYLELAPELEPYFVTGSHDDEAGIRETYQLTSGWIGSLLSSTPFLVATVNAMVGGVLAGLAAEAAGLSDAIAAVIAVAVTTALAGLFVHWARQQMSRGQQEVQPRFPG